MGGRVSCEDCLDSRSKLQNGEVLSANDEQIGHLFDQETCFAPLNSLVTFSRCKEHHNLAGSRLML